MQIKKVIERVNLTKNNIERDDFSVEIIERDFYRNPIRFAINLNSKNSKDYTLFVTMKKQGGNFIIDRIALFKGVIFIHFLLNEELDNFLKKDTSNVSNHIKILENKELCRC